MVEMSGIEPLASCLQGRRSPKLSYTPNNIIRPTAHPFTAKQQNGGPIWS